MGQNRALHGTVWWRQLLHRNATRHGAPACAGILLILLLTSVLTPYANYQLATIACYVVAAAGLTMLTGQNGQISLGHGALMAVGAYSCALVMANLSWPLWASYATAVVVTSATGALVGAAAARLRGPYLAGATLAFAAGLPPLALHFSHALGGATGLGVGTGQPAWAAVPPTRWQAWVTCLAAVVTLTLLANLQCGRVGRAFRAVRDNDVTAALAGINAARIRVVAFTVSAACAGLAGALYATVIGLVAPGGFPISLSLSLVTAIVLGGMGSLTGSVWGGIILVVLPTVTGTFGTDPTRSANFSIMIYGVLLVSVMLIFPRGIQGAIGLLTDSFIRPRLSELRGLPRAREGSRAR